MKLVYIYSELPSYVRVKKNLKVFSEVCSETHFIGANRNGSDWDSRSAASNVFCHIFEGRIPNGGIGSILQGVKFSLYAARKLRNVRPDVVVLGNEEAYVPFFFSGLSRKKTVIVCELLDSLAIRLSGNLQILTPLTRLFSSYVLNVSDRIIEVSNERLLRHSTNVNKFSVIHNSPEESSLIVEEVPRNVKNHLENMGNFIYVSGSVVPLISDVESLLLAVSDLNKSGSDISIVYSGRLNSEWAENVFFDNQYVHNLGCLTPNQSLEIARRSLAMFAFYKPINLNYIYAAPNKVYDSIRIAKPILMNSECKAKSLPDRYGLLLESGFGDVNGLKSNIARLLDGNYLDQQKQSDIKKNYDQEFAWPVMAQRWKKVLNEVKYEKK